MSYNLLLKLSRSISSWSPKQLRPTALSTIFHDDFKHFYPDLIDNTMSKYKYQYPPEVRSFFKKMLEYFTVCKLPTQGEFMIFAYALLEQPENLTNEKLHQAYAIACAIEAVQSGLTIYDDFVYNVSTRAGKAAWHLLPDSSNMVLIDTHILRTFVYEMLQQNLPESTYTQIMDTLNEMYLETEMGQLMDLSLLHCKDFDRFTPENYEQMVSLKTSCRAFNLSLKLSLVLSGKATEDNMRLVKYMYNDLSVLISINNNISEYLAYGDEVPYNSSQNGICTWPAVTALRICNEEQKKIFKDSYGSSDPDKIARIVKLYDDVDLKNLYKQEEAIRFERYLKKVHNLPPQSIPSPKFFLKVFKIIKSYLK